MQNLAKRENDSIRINVMDTSIIFENIFDLCRDKWEVENAYDIIKSLLDLECEARISILEDEE